MNASLAARARIQRARPCYEECFRLNRLEPTSAVAVVAGDVDNTRWPADCNSVFLDQPTQQSVLVANEALGMPATLSSLRVD